MAEAQLLAADARKDRRFYVFNAVASVAAVGLIWYLLLRRNEGAATVDLRFMPTVNACLNALSSVLMISGFIAVKNRRPDIHRYFMVGAVFASALFLVGYLAYHAVHGDTKYVGAFRGLYLFILATHVLLSIAVVPMLLTALYFAARRQFERHKKVTRVLFPIWLYVSVTGVVVYFFLRGM